MALIKTNALASTVGHLDPFTFTMFIPTVPVAIPLPHDVGTGTSDVIEIGRYNEIALHDPFPGGHWDIGTSFINFEGCDTPDGTFAPIKFGGSATASDPLRLAVGVLPVPLPWFLLGGAGFGGGSATANSYRGLTVPYLRFFVEGNSGLLTGFDLIVTLKMSR